MKIINYKTKVEIPEIKWQCSCLKENIAKPKKLSEKAFKVFCDNCKQRFELKLSSSFNLAILRKTSIQGSLFNLKEN